jgi:outer membrane protein assembly factor BamD (BamD/ComL family)
VRAVVVFFLLVSTVLARADEADDQTRHAAELYDSGTKHYRLAEFDAALKDFQEGYRLRSDPAFLFNIGQCQRQLGDLDGAMHSFGSYLKELPNAPNAPEVRHLLGTLQSRIDARPPKPEPTPPPASEPAREQSASAGASLTTSAPTSAPRKSHRWVWAVVAVGSVALIGTAIGLGVGLTRSHSPDTSLGTSVPSFQ